MPVHGKLPAEEDAAFRIGIEWDLRDDQLVDLQTNHAITSPKTQTVTTSQRGWSLSLGKRLVGRDAVKSK